MNEQECTTVNEQQCTTVYDTVTENDCSSSTGKILKLQFAGLLETLCIYKFYLSIGFQQG